MKLLELTRKNLCRMHKGSKSLTTAGISTTARVNQIIEATS